jgi:hypothetical protein
MSASFDVVLKDDKKKSYSDTACFAPHYYAAHNVQTWKVRIPTVESGWDLGGTTRLPDDEVRRYLNAIKAMGFNFTYKLGEFNGRKCFTATIQSSENTEIACLLVLNALRYLYEDNMVFIPEAFLKWIKPEDKPNELLNKLFMAHYLDTIRNSNHSFLQHYTILVPLSQEEFDEIILKNTDHVTHVNENLRHVTPNMSLVALRSKMKRAESFEEAKLVYDGALIEA